MAFHWVDSARTEPFAPTVATRRELMVYVWYPARERQGSGQGGGHPEGPYVPHVAAIARALGDSLTREEFGAAISAVMAGTVRSYVVDGAPLSTSRATFPVLLFSHGFGEASLTYAGQLTDLASHGYVVFAVEHPYDAFAVWFPDGRVVPFAASAWDAAQHRPSGAVAYQLAQVPIRAADMRFVLDRVIRLEAVPSLGNPFAHRLDLTRVGAFGHSLGGVAAASACRTDARIRACANEDADDDGRPWDGGPEAHLIKQPFLFFASGHSIYVSPRTPLPTAAALEQMKLTRVQYDSIVQLYQHNQDAALAATPGGALRIMAESDAFTHRTFIDLKLLQSTSDSAAATQRHYMDLIRSYVLAFFDQTLLGRTDSILARPTPPDSIITVQRFGR
jgi:predicted dienelactone hydrolase